MSAQELSRKAVRAWLLDYAWIGSAEEKARTVDCILAQGEWRYISGLADKFAGAQPEPGPEAFEEGMTFALSALYECHAGPHLPSCPDTQPCRHSWVAGMVYVSPEDLAGAAACREVECEQCGKTVGPLTPIGEIDALREEF